MRTYDVIAKAWADFESCFAFGKMAAMLQPVLQTGRP